MSDFKYKYKYNFRSKTRIYSACYEPLRTSTRLNSNWSDKYIFTFFIFGTCFFFFGQRHIHII